MHPHKDQQRVSIPPSHVLCPLSSCVPAVSLRPVFLFRVSHFPLFLLALSLPSSPSFPRRLWAPSPRTLGRKPWLAPSNPPSSNYFKHRVQARHGHTPCKPFRPNRYMGRLSETSTRQRVELTVICAMSSTAAGYICRLYIRATRSANVNKMAPQTAQAYPHGCGPTNCAGYHTVAAPHCQPMPCHAHTLRHLAVSRAVSVRHSKGVCTAFSSAEQTTVATALHWLVFLFRLANHIIHHRI